MKILVILLISLGILSCQSARNGKDKQSEGEISLKVEKFTLDNGLTVLVVENKKLPVFTYYTYFKVGGKYEYKGITGASHFLEHMMFKGAKKYGQGEFDRVIEGSGGTNNAYTSNDLTVYYESLPSEHFELIADLEADRMENLELELNSFQQEKKVVLEERRMRYENSDQGKLYLDMMQEMFVGTPYGTSVIGDVKDLLSVKRDQIKDFFNLYYAPNNAVIVLVGDLETDKVKKIMKEKFGKIKASKSLESTKKKRLAEKGFDFKGSYNRSIELKGTTPHPMFMLAFQGSKIGPREGFIADILASVLADGESSYLSQKYVTGKNPVLGGISGSNYTLQESGVFFFAGQLLEKKSLKDFKKDIFKTLKNSCESAITERSVQKVKNQYLVQMLSSLDTNAGIASFLGNREVYFGDYSFYKKELEIYNSVSVEELKVVCQKYIDENKSIFLSIWNKH